MKCHILKVCTILLCLFLTACKAPETTSSEPTASTLINDTIKTTFDKHTGTLTVSGVGILADLFPVHEDDWEEYDNNTVRHIVIEEGITHLSNAFNHLVAVESIQFPSTLHTIERSFGECSALKALTIPATVKRIADYSFVCCDSLEDLRFEGPIEIDCRGCFTYLSIETVTIPDNSVYCTAFRACRNLNEVIIGANVACHDSTPQNYCGSGFFKIGDNLRVYIHEPLYSGDTYNSAQLDDLDYYLPIIIPEGKTAAEYKNEPMPVNPDWIDTSIDDGQMADPAPRYKKRVPKE